MPRYDPKTRKALQELGELVALAARDLEAARKKKGTRRRTKAGDPRDIVVPRCAHPDRPALCKGPPPPPPMTPFVIQVSLPPDAASGKPGNRPVRSTKKRPVK